jgi:di/tripeptidase
VAAASEVLHGFGVPAEDISYRVGSTDANVPLSRGIPAVTIYLTRGHNVHRLDEWLSLEYLPLGMSAAWQLMQRAIDDL